MAGRTPHEAVERFLRPLQRTISCVTTAVLDNRGGSYPRPQPHSLLLNTGFPVRLAGESRLALSFALEYLIVSISRSQAPWRVRMVSYFFQMEDDGGREVFASHWHPRGIGYATMPHLHSLARYRWCGLCRIGHATMPHLHLGARARVGRSELVGAHLPTGRVIIARVLRLAIAELGVRPIRADWARYLAG